MTRLWAACLKTSVRRTTGTAPESMMSASTCPGPRKAAGPRRRRAAGRLVRHRPEQRPHQRHVNHRGLVDDQQITVQWVVLVALELARPGSVSSSRWIVLASTPVLSDSRLAARPVGAQSAIVTVFASKIFRIELTSVVLPTPGPPVMTSTLDARASAPLRAGSRRGPALSASRPRDRPASIDRWPWRLPGAEHLNFAAISRSARYSAVRKTQRRPSTSSPITVPSRSSRPRAVSTSSAGTSSNSRAKRGDPRCGRPQWPSSIASASANEISARTRISAVFSIPSLAAIWSAVRKPMPWMSRASRYGFS